MPTEYEVPHGPSILEMIWAQLDEAYALLMAPPHDPKLGRSAIEEEDHRELRGTCAGLAIAIAILRNPYEPDDDIIREEAAERYEERVA